jgi:ankyrin repeat protein
VQNGADVNCQRTTDGWTPLFLAVVFNMTPMVTLLLQLGAKAVVRDAKRMTVEDWADRCRLKNIKDILLHR